MWRLENITIDLSTLTEGAILMSKYAPQASYLRVLKGRLGDMVVVMYGEGRGR
jgi:hypothetical protein